MFPLRYLSLSYSLTDWFTILTKSDLVLSVTGSVKSNRASLFVMFLCNTKPVRALCTLCSCFSIYFGMLFSFAIKNNWSSYFWKPWYSFSVYIYLYKCCNWIKPAQKYIISLSFTVWVVLYPFAFKHLGKRIYSKKIQKFLFSQCFL